MWHLASVHGMAHVPDHTTVLREDCFGVADELRQSCTDDIKQESK